MTNVVASYTGYGGIKYEVVAVDNCVRGKTYCCLSFQHMIESGVFTGNDNCRDGSTWINANALKFRIDFCPFCGGLIT